jgi:DNA-binding GntR family transcriptional regulator
MILIRFESRAQRKMDTPVVARKRAVVRKTPDRKGGHEKSKTRSEQLLHRLESEILSGAIPPGTRLDEATLAARFGVSRTPVREVLRHLASSGLVQMRPRHGAVVRQFTLAELLEMFQVMAELEGLCARLAARRITVQDKVRLRASHEACIAAVKANNEDEFFAANNVFHDLLSNASRNSFLIAQQRDLRRRLDPYRRYITGQPGRMEGSVVEHEAIVAAVERGDAAAAADAMRFHVNMLGEEAGDFVAVLSHAEAGGRVLQDVATLEPRDDGLLKTTKRRFTGRRTGQARG